jgi:hypothetical protein
LRLVVTRRMLQTTADRVIDLRGEYEARYAALRREFSNAMSPAHVSSSPVRVRWAAWLVCSAVDPLCRRRRRIPTQEAERLYRAAAGTAAARRSAADRKSAGCPAAACRWASACAGSRDGRRRRSAAGVPCTHSCRSLPLTLGKGHRLRGASCDPPNPLTRPSPVSRHGPHSVSGRCAMPGLAALPRNRPPFAASACGRGADVAHYRSAGLEAEGFDHTKTSAGPAPSGEGSTWSPRCSSCRVSRTGWAAAP